MENGGLNIGAECLSGSLYGVEEFALAAKVQG